MGLESVPEGIQGLKAWLLWKQGAKKPDGKFGKIPYYALTGEKRHGEQGSQADRAKLVTFQEASNALTAADGLGLALLADLGLVVLDCDHVRDPETGALAPWAVEVCAGTYTEVSPSGNGLRAIFYGEMPDGKNHQRGFEVFCRKGFVTITGQQLPSAPSEIALLEEDRAERIHALLGRQARESSGKFKKKITRETSAERVRAALEHLDPEDRELWLKVGWALGRAFEQSDEGWELYEEWAKRSSKFADSGNTKHMRKEYFERSKQERDKTITLATIFKLARSSGWKEGPLVVEDFYAYLPAHQYFHIPTRALWPGSSINSTIFPWPEMDGKPMQPSAWLDQKRAVEQATWHPDYPELVEDKVAFEGGWLDRPGARTFNMYRPPMLIAGDARAAGPWRDHLARIFPEYEQHLTNWLAHRIQHPGDKVNHALVLGGAQGIGKDTLLEPVKKGVGSWNWKEIAPSAMLGRFNSWVKAVVVRVSEIRDLGDVDRFTFYDHSKTYIAAPPDVITCDEKHLREHPVHNVSGYIFTTNHKTGGLFLPPDDRRHYVAWSEMTHEDFEEDFWRKFWAWLMNDGIGAVVAYLHSVNLEKFDPKAPPPKTDAWWAIVQSNVSPEDTELSGVMEKLGRPDVVTLRMMIDAARSCDENDLADMLNDRKSRRRIPHLLERCGYGMVRNPNAPKTEGYWLVWGKQCAVYARKELDLSKQIAAAEKLAASEQPF